MSVRKGTAKAFLFVFALVLPIVAIGPTQHAYAKGAVRSDKSDDRKSNDRKSDSRDSSDRQSNNRSSNSRDSGNSGSSDRSINSRSGDNSSSTSTTSTVRDNRSDTRNSSQSRSGTAYSRNSSDTTNTRGVYRKNYEDIGKIWKNRTERRTSSNDWRTSNKTHGNSYHGTTNIYHFPGSYSYYDYDYRPGRVFPSLYCYYYGFFPPYVNESRIVIASHIRRLDALIILPIYYRDRDSDYYYDYDHASYHSYYGGYYNSKDYTYRGLTDVMLDIQKAWEHGDISYLKKHVNNDAMIDVFLDGEYSYTVDRKDYIEMTDDAIKSIRTSSFRFEQTKSRSMNEVVLYGKHTYYDYSDDGKSTKTSIYVSYALKRVGRDWNIIEVGTSLNSLY